MMTIALPCNPEKFATPSPPLNVPTIITDRCMSVYQDGAHGYIAHHGSA